MNDRITLEELESNLEEREDEHQRVLSALESLFGDAQFEKKEEKNTIDFEDTHEGLKALFSIDNTTYRYTCYITVEGDNSSTYSAKGNIDGIEDAAEKFLSEYSDLVTLDSNNIEQSEEEDEDVATGDDIPDEELSEE